jgi:hypothetical protein
MHHARVLSYLLAATASLALIAACQPAGGGGGVSKDLEKKISKLEKGQQQILAKLDKVAKAGPAKPQARPGRPDPSKVYSVPVPDGARTKGVDTAKITIIEVSEFQ